jgi:hypothetical protein
MQEHQATPDFPLQPLLFFAQLAVALPKGVETPKLPEQPIPVSNVVAARAGTAGPNTFLYENIESFHL